MKVVDALKKNLSNGVCCGLCFALLIVIVSCARHESSSDSLAAGTSNNLSQIYLILRRGNILPKSLAEMGDPVNSKLFSSVDSNLFVSPRNTSNSGSFRDIEDWTDFIYVGNLTDNVLQKAAMLISPDENHNDSYGVVLFVDGTILQLPPE